MHFFTLLGGGLIALASLAHAEVTVYGQIPFTQTQSSNNPTQTKLAAYNDTQLTPPAVPNPAPNTTFTLNLPRNAADVVGLSIPHVGGSFWGFSIEMSVINQVLGKNSTHMEVPFLNLMENLVERAGNVFVRLGGNTQEHASLVDVIENGSIISKESLSEEDSRTTDTPAVLYTKELFYLTSNISHLTNVKWFFGVPFNDSVNWRTEIVEYGEQILGSNLMAIQAGNEPDFFVKANLRTGPYSQWDYFGEFGTLVANLDNNPNIPIKNNLVAPNLGGGEGGWVLEQVWDTGFLDVYVDRLYAFAVEHYPNNNCYAQYGIGSYVDPQTEFASYLNHTAGKALIAPYLNSTLITQKYNKPWIMFETNTASCGGFAGISDSYGAALWAMDYGFQMAYSNFTHGFLHTGGQNVFYNPFTSPPTNQSTYNEWTLGSIFYSAMVLAEAFGKTNTSQIVDLNASDGNIYTPAYGIYENGVLSKAALFNFVDDDSGASNLVVTLSVPNSGVPGTVKVKYLEADSVSVKNNITWAGQTFGGTYEVDGRLKGDLNITTIYCDTNLNKCDIPLKAPGFALVFLDGGDSLLSLGRASQTYATTAYTRLTNTVTVDPKVVATSNGHSGKDRVKMGSTSPGSGARSLGTSRVMMKFILLAGGALLL